MEKSVYFRSFELEDAPLIHRWRNDESLLKLSVGLNKNTCMEEDVEWVRSRMHNNPYAYWWAICDRTTDKMIGYMSLTDIHFINSSANFSGIVIGDKAFQDGLAWIESYLFAYEFVFERLNLNRIYGRSMVDHQATQIMREVMFSVIEGVQRQAIFKNGRYHDLYMTSVLRSEYLEHKANGDYEMSAVLKRMRETIRRNRKTSVNAE